MLLHTMIKGTVKEIVKRIGALDSDEETLGGAALILNVYLDGKLVKKVDMPMRFIIRNHEVFHAYELEPGKHTLKIEAVDPHEKIMLDLGSLLVYSK